MFTTSYNITVIVGENQAKIPILFERRKNMGLDMYLIRSPRYKNTTPPEVNVIMALFDYENRCEKYKKFSFKKYTGHNRSELPPSDVIAFYRKVCDVKNGFGRIDEEVGYWRKANAIHRWILEATDSEDKCQLIYIDGEKLKKLAEACKTVLNNHDLAEEVLPTQQSFFFGGTEYDEYYFEELQRTYDMLKDIDWQDIFYYQASW